MTFSETVDVTGTPRLPLDIGGTTRHATAAPVEGATVVDFTYTVDAADYDADGFEISENTLELDGGTIRRAGADVDADLDHPGVGASSDYTVNGVVIDEVRMVSEAPHGRFYTLDDDIEFGVTFNRSVKVTGTPQLAFCLNRSGQSCKDKKADYDRGSDSETVVFRYTVQAGDEDNNGIWIVADAVSLNGGAITQEDDSRRAAYLGHGAQGTQADHRVNAQAEIIGGGVTVTSSPRAATATYGAGERIEITVTFGAPVIATTATDFVLSVDGAKRAPLLRGSGTNQLVFGYTVEPGDEDNNGIWIGDQSRTLVGNREGDPQNGAITRVATGLAAGLTHGGLGTQSGHKVDGSLTPPNSAPVITTTSPVETPENGTAVATLAATDFESDPITWSTTGGADADRFALTTAGALTFVAAPDYESPADVASGDPANAAADNEYVVFVTASDGTDGTELELVVRVTNVDEGQSGTVSIDNTAPMIGDELTASTLDVADPDGLPDPFEPTWQWYYSVPGTGEFVITGATSATFMVGEFESGLAFIAKASWTDAGGFANTLASVPTAEGVFCALNPGDLWCAGMTVDSLRLIGGGNGRGFRSGQAGDLTNRSFQYNGVSHTVQAVYYVFIPSSASLPAGALALAIEPAVPDGLKLLLGGEEFSESNAMRYRDEIFWERSGVNWSFGEQVTLRLQPEAPPTVTVAAATGGETVTEGTDAAFTLSRTEATTVALTVTVKVSETVAVLKDASVSPSSVTFAAGAATATLALATDDDDTDNDDGTVTVTLGAGAGYTLGDQAAATVAVSDNDVPVDFVLAVPSTVAEDAGTATVTVTATTAENAPPATLVEVQLARVGGTATGGSDYEAVSETATFQVSDFAAVTVDGQPRYQAAWTHDVTIIDDGVGEGDETLVLEISASSGFQSIHTLGGGRDPVRATVTIVDDDASTDATLSDLVVNDGNADLTLTPTFASGTTTYTAMVAYAVAEVTVTPTKNATGATIEYLDGSDATLTDADTSDPGHQVAVAEGDTVIQVKVTAEDGAPTQTYTVTVKRAAVPPTIDTVEVTSTPLLTSSGGSTPNTYGVGETIEVSVTFDEPVTATTDTDFVLSVSGAKRAPLLRGSGTATLVFGYTVLAADSDGNGIWIGDQDRTLVGNRDGTAQNGTIASVATTVAADLTHSQLGERSGHRVDGARSIVLVAVTSTPLLTSSSGSTPDTYGAGEKIRFTVSFNAAVDVTGDPVSTFSLGGPDDIRRVDAAYESGSGTAELVFGYTVVSTDMDPNGIYQLGGVTDFPDESDPGPVALDADDSIVFTGTGTDAPLAYPDRQQRSGHKVDGSRTAGNSAPAITTTSPVETPENGTAVATLAATDADDDPITWSKTGGADADRFALTASGVLTFVAAPDYESPVDVTSADPANAAANNEYVVFVTASDGTADTADTELKLVVQVSNADEGQSGTVSIDDTAPMVGDELTASTAADVDDPDGLPDPFAPTWKWYRTPSGGAEAEISGATSATYTVVEADLDAALTAKARWTDAGGFANTLASAPTAAVTRAEALPAVTIVADHEAFTAVLDLVTFTLTRTEDPAAALDVSVALTQDKDLIGSEYLAQTVTFRAGEATATLNIHAHFFAGSTVTGETALTATVQDGSGYVPGSPNTASTRIRVADPAVTASFEQAAYTFDEAAGDATLAVILLTATGVPVPHGDIFLSINTETITGGASPGGVDFENPAGSIQFVPSDFTADGTNFTARKEVTLAIVDDALDEPDEALTVILEPLASTQAVVALSQPDGTACPMVHRCDATVTITDNDESAVATLSALAVSGGGADLLTFASDTTTYTAMVTNDVETLTFTATKSDAGASVAYLDSDGTLDDADTTEDGFQVALAVGANAITVRVTAENGTAVQDYTVTVTRAEGLPTVTVAAAAGGETVTEGTDAAFTLSRTGSTTAALTVAVAVSETGSVLKDASAVPSSVTFDAGAATATLALATNDDDTDDDDGTVTVTLGAGAVYTVGDPGAATVAVSDNDVPVDFVLAVPATVAEDAGPVTVTVTATTAENAPPATLVEVQLARVGGTATGGSDYEAVSETVRFQVSAFAPATVDGQSRYQAEWTHDVVIHDDEVVEGDETLVLEMSPTSAFLLIHTLHGAQDAVQATLTIVDNDVANAAPTAADQTVTTDEDTAYAFDASDFGFVDTDTDDELASVRVVTLPGSGTLAVSGSAVSVDREVAASDLGGNLTYTPVADEHGSGYASFTFRVSDGTDESAAAYTMTIDVNAVNDAPTAADRTVTTDEDTAYAFDASDFGFADTDTGAELASVRVVTVPGSGTLAVSGSAVSVDREVAASDLGGNLTYTPAADGHGSGYASFTFRVSDGTAESAAAYTMTIDVTPVNDAPTAADGTVTTDEDTAYAFDASDFGFADTDTGDGLASVRVVTVPGSGTLAVSGSAVSADREVAASDLGGNLTYTPAADGHGSGYASFTFRVSDGTDESAAAYTMTIDVTPVNDTPTAADRTVTTDEDTAYAFDASDFGFTDADTGAELASVRVVTVPGSGTLAVSGAAVSADQEVAASDLGGNLTFAPAENEHGSGNASFTFRVSDGTDESAADYTMTIDVNAVNDAPTLASALPDRSATAGEEFSYQVPEDAFSDVDDDTLSYAAAQDDDSALPAWLSFDATTRTFSGTAVAGDTGTVTVRVTASDGNDETASTTFALEVTAAANTVPTAADQTVTTDEDTAYAFDASDFGFADTDTGAELASVRVVTVPGSGTLAVSGSAVSVDREVAASDLGGSLTYTPAADGHGIGYASFTFRVSDGTDESASTYTMTIDVNAVNDAPTAADGTVTTDEDTAYAFGASDFGFADTDTGDGLASVRVVTVPGSGTLAVSGSAVSVDREVAASDLGGNLTYTPAADGHGSGYASFTFRVSDGTDESAADYTMTIDVNAVNDAPSAGTVTIDDTAPVVGDELTATAAGIADPDGLPAPLTLSWQWYRTPAGGNETEIAGAMAATYTVREDDAGAALTAKATYQDSGGFANTLASAPTGAVGRVPVLSVGNASATEGNAVSFQVALTAASTQAVTVDWAASAESGDTAGSGDFTAANGALTFTAGQTEKAVTVSTTEDTIDEEDETFTLRLSNATNATLATDPTATGTIRDDDEANAPPPPVAPEGEATAGSYTSLDVRWTAPTGGPAVTGYELRYREHLLPVRAHRAAAHRQGGAWTEWPHRGTGTEATITGLKVNTAYEVDVRAVYGEVRSAWVRVPGTVRTGAPEAARIRSVTVVSGPGSDGVWGAGERVELEVRYSLPVAVEQPEYWENADGERHPPGPFVVVAFRGDARPGYGEVLSMPLVPYAGGSGTDRLRFSYRVGAAEAGARGVAVADGTLLLRGATIRTLESGDGEPEFIRTRVFQVNVRAPAGGDGAWTAGDTVRVEVRFTGPAAAATTRPPNWEEVVVDETGGTPSIGVRLGDGQSRPLAHTASYETGSRTNTLTFEYAVTAGDGRVSAVEVVADSLARNGATMRNERGYDAELDHLGTLRYASLAALMVRGAAAVREGGTLKFPMELARASEAPVTVDYATADGTATAGKDYTATRGTVTFAPGRTRKTVEVRVLRDEEAEDAETVVLRLSNAHSVGSEAPVEVTVPEAKGMIEDVAPEAPSGVLTARFARAPAEHDGKTAFKLLVAFSEGIKIGFRTFRDQSLSVSGGSVTKAKRVDRRRDLWEVTVKPGSLGDVTVTLEGGRACGTAGAVCTGDGRALSATISTTVLGPVALSVADARVREAEDALLVFEVTLDRARHAAVTVDYVTSDVTARAGEDYTSASGTLTFATGERSKTVEVTVLDDAHDEGEETLTLTLSNPSGAYLADATATGTIENSDHMPKAWMVRFGRTVGSQVVDALTQRLDGAGGSHVTVAGINLIGAPGLGPQAEDDAPFGLPEWAKNAEREADVRTITAEDIRLRSAFHLSSGGDGTHEGGPTFTAWGRVATGGFEAEEDDVTMDGDVTTGLVGFDAEWERALAGIMLSQSSGDGSYRLDPAKGDDAGTVESSLTGVYPYARVDLNRQVSAWALAGIGSGELTLHQQGEKPMPTDISMRMGAVGVKGKVLDGTGASGVSLDVKTDAMWVGTKSERTNDMVATEGDVTRVRLILQGERRFEGGNGATFTPSAEVGLRHDGGDAETGTGVEVGAGLRYTAGAVTVEAQARTLLVHEASGYEEWGMSGAIRVTPDASGRGLTLSIAPVWGRTGSAAERLWSAHDARALGADSEFEAGSRLALDAGYGIGLAHRRGVLTPYAGLTLGDAGNRTVRTGTRWQLGPDAMVALEGSRQTSRAGEADNRLMLRVALRF